MGLYINYDSKGKRLPYFEKVKHLVDDGATIVEQVWQENLICVVETHTHDAAVYAESERSFEYYKRPDGRVKTWLIHPMAKELSGYLV